MTEGKSQMEIAQEIAVRVHGNQKDKGGSPYLDHVRRVAGMAMNERQFILGLLHDVVEDSKEISVRNLLKELNLDFGHAVISITPEFKSQVQHFNCRMEKLT